MRPAAFRIAWGMAAVLAGPSLAAKERLVRQLGSELPTPPQYVRKLAQDPTGYLWIGTDGGLFRYDGVELRPWAPEVIDQPIWDIAVGDDSSLYATGREEMIYRVTATGAEPVAGPAGGYWHQIRRIAVDARHRLWVVTREGPLLRQAARGSWEEPLRAVLEEEEERSLVVKRDGDGVLVVTNRGLWHVDSNDRPQRLTSLAFDSFGLDPRERPVDLLRMPDGSLRMLTFGGWVFTYRDRQLTLTLKAAGNGWALALRGETVWIASTGAITALRPDGTVEPFAQSHPGERRAWTILVDHEGSLWVGNARGAFQFPEPDTVAWSKADGLATQSKKLARATEGLWISSWEFMYGLIQVTPEGLRARTFDAPRVSLPLCASASGTLWGIGEPTTKRESWILSRKGGAFRFHRRASALAACNESPDGGVWLFTGDQLFFASAMDQLSELGFSHDDRQPFEGEVPFEDSRGVLWLPHVREGTTELCHAPVAELRAGRRPAFTCVPVGDLKDVYAIVEAPSGAIWLATRQSGVLRYDGTTPERLPGSRELPSANVDLLEPARAGGFWISGSGYLWRVVERTDLPAGWSVEERLGPANGIMALGSSDVREEDDGTLWLTSAAGVVQVPPSARTPRPSQARVQLQRVTVNGHAVDPSTPVQVPYGTNEVALDLAALLFRDPSSIRYRIRLGSEAPWSTPSRSSRIQLMDVPSGSYQVEVSATTDEVSWTMPAAVLDFRVPRPWHRQPAVWGLAGLGVLGAAISAQRARSAVRLKLERQRTQIALDLHDEMGSGLGSIRVLASMAARGAVDTEKLRQAAAKIERTARDLGQAMSGIVWSLREGRRTLRDLCAHVAERGHELFPAESPDFDTAFPAEWPDEALPLPARRNLQLILMEALHNAAKHAQASQVVLGAAQEEGRWRLWVEDDGAGIKGRPAGHVGGHGLPGMAERARSIEAALVIGRARASVSGTRVEVILPPPRFPSWRLTRGLEEAREAWRTSRS